MPARRLPCKLQLGLMGQPNPSSSPPHSLLLPMRPKTVILECLLGCVAPRIAYSLSEGAVIQIHELQLERGVCVKLLASIAAMSPHTFQSRVIILLPSISPLLQESPRPCLRLMSHTRTHLVRLKVRNVEGHQWAPATRRAERNIRARKQLRTVPT